MPRTRPEEQRFHRVSGMRRAGFTLAEALVSITLISLAGSALLLATELTLDASADALEANVADGLANQMIEEILGLPYVEKGESASQQWWQLGPESDEYSRPVVRANYDDMDDYRVLLARNPMTDEFAIELGQGDGGGGLRHPNFRLSDTYFDGWLLYVVIWHADESDLSANLYTGRSISDFRAIEVSIWKRADDGTWSKLTSVRRVIGYVPPVARVSRGAGSNCNSTRWTMTTTPSVALREPCHPLRPAASRGNQPSHRDPWRRPAPRNGS
ncbi:MAG: hypothetical protein CMJ64_29860 [Planctomycetaceae bacterium]|nr:hypothetical protein [Planctomycetaceae bacterium]